MNIYIIKIFDLIKNNNVKNKILNTFKWLIEILLYCICIQISNYVYFIVVLAMEIVILRIFSEWLILKNIKFMTFTGNLLFRFKI